ncbi:MAG TPA: hypothetical protein VJS64_10130 [Pyrinomonadaceae bacterium]|nr:hypothetical protein [Pyrinomonadaceae bacterium]
MSNLMVNRRARLRTLSLLGAALCGAVLVMPQALGQKRGEDSDKPLYQEYRGIQLGMAADDVRKKLGAPADKSDEQDFFMLNDAESAQIFYDKTKKVMAISANFLQGAQNIPTPRALFGEELAAKADGSVYKMTRYPKAGCWLSYSKTAGNSPLVSVTLQKID